MSDVIHHPGTNQQHDADMALYSASEETYSDIEDFGRPNASPTPDLPSVRINPDFFRALEGEMPHLPETSRPSSPADIPVIPIDESYFDSLKADISAPEAPTATNHNLNTIDGRPGNNPQLSREREHVLLSLQSVFGRDKEGNPVCDLVDPEEASRSTTISGTRPLNPIEVLERISLYLNYDSFLKNWVSGKPCALPLVVNPAAGKIRFIMLPSQHQPLKALQQILSHLSGFDLCLRTGSTMEKREFYYRAPHLFRNQRESDDLLFNLATTLNLRFADLGVVASARSRFAGSPGFSFTCHGPNGTYVVRGEHGRAQALPPISQSQIHVDDRVKCIVVYEKMCALTNAIKHGITHKFKDIGECVIMTGLGQGDHNIKEVLNLLCKHTGLPIFLVTDSDPFGIDIAKSYQIGSQRSGHLNEYLQALSAEWIGLKASEWSNLHLRIGDILPLNEYDYACIERLLRDPTVPEVYNNITPRNELLIMRDKKAKVELQALYSASHDLAALVEYVVEKIRASFAQRRAEAEVQPVSNDGLYENPTEHVQEPLQDTEVGGDYDDESNHGGLQDHLYELDSPIAYTNRDEKGEYLQTYYDARFDQVVAMPLVSKRITRDQFRSVFLDVTSDSLRATYDVLDAVQRISTPDRQSNLLDSVICHVDLEGYQSMVNFLANFNDFDYSGASELRQSKSGSYTLNVHTIAILLHFARILLGPGYLKGRSGCPFCPHSTLLQSRLLPHIKVHTGISRFGCPVPGCDLWLKTCGLLTQHYKHKHKDGPAGWTPKLRSQAEAEANARPETAVFRKRKHEYTEEELLVAKDLTQYAYGRNTAITAGELEGVAENLDAVSWICPCCFKGCDDEHSFEEHLTTHILDELDSWVCTDCGKPFAYRSQLRDHMPYHLPSELR
ncbi:hypothetical protein FRC07_002479, partial [Ceratobasidium sp. 392]